jgi:hypothetical protein
MRRGLVDDCIRKRLLNDERHSWAKRLRPGRVNRGLFGALIRRADRWRGLRFIEFELRQIAAVRKELDQE